jgi:hypothetical protein
MTDDLSKRGKQDRDRINLNEPHEVRRWAQKFGCSEDELREAVKRVGSMADDVERAIKRT